MAYIQRIVFTTVLIAASICCGGEIEEVQRIAPVKWPGAKIEVRLDDGTRCDILTEEYAIEADFSRKWAEAVGQALHYSAQTGKKPGILILKKSNDEWKHLVRVAFLCGKFDIKLWIENIPTE